MIQKHTLGFLRKLKNNNSRDWFHANKDLYNAAKENINDFTIQLIDELKKQNKNLSGLVPKDCVFRIFRDVRFSKNKDPYKTNFGVVISEGGRKSPLAAFYIQIEPKSSFIAGGCWMPDGATLKKIRQEIDYNYKDFKKIINSKKFKEMFGELADNRLKTTPKGYDKTNPAIDHLRLTSFVVTANLSDNVIADKDLIKECANTYKAMSPLLEFLNVAIR